jgi:hypothetical protein
MSRPTPRKRFRTRACPDAPSASPANARRPSTRSTPPAGPLPPAEIARVSLAAPMDHPYASRLAPSNHALSRIPVYQLEKLVVRALARHGDRMPIALERAGGRSPSPANRAGALRRALEHVTMTDQPQTQLRVKVEPTLLLRHQIIQVPPLFLRACTPFVVVIEGRAPEQVDRRWWRPEQQSCYFSTIKRIARRLSVPVFKRWTSGGGSRGSAEPQEAGAGQDSAEQRQPARDRWICDPAESSRPEERCSDADRLLRFAASVVQVRIVR